jgi:hypothetical protein
MGLQKIILIQKTQDCYHDVVVEYALQLLFSFNKTRDPGETHHSYTASYLNSVFTEFTFPLLGSMIL